MKKSYISLAALTGLLSLSLLSCTKDKKDDKKETTTQTTSETSTSTSNTSVDNSSKTSTDLGTATLRVIDFDDEVLFDGEVPAGDNLYNTLINTNGILLEATGSAPSHYLTSINGSIVDSNLSLMIYENDVESWDTCDTLSVDNGDVIEIKNTFWNTKSMYPDFAKCDDTDVLVDKTIYKYIKTNYRESLNEYFDVFGSSYWQYLLSNKAIENGYDISLFNLRESTSELISSINQYDYSKIGYKADNTLDDTQFFKFYYTAMQVGGFDEDTHPGKLDAFKAALKTYADANITTSYYYNQYTSAFVLSLLNKLKINVDTIKNIAYNTDGLDIERGQWGNYTDQLVWQVLAFSAIESDLEEPTFGNFILDELNVRADEFNCTSLTASVAAFAALGVNPRDTKYEINGEDIIENILDNFYDEESGLLKIEKTDTTIPGFSTNQIYTYLFAYKMSRDKQDNSGEFAKINLFA